MTGGTLPRAPGRSSAVCFVRNIEPWGNDRVSWFANALKAELGNAWPMRVGDFIARDETKPDDKTLRTLPQDNSGRSSVTLGGDFGGQAAAHAPVARILSLRIAVVARPSPPRANAAGHNGTDSARCEAQVDPRRAGEPASET